MNLFYRQLEQTIFIDTSSYSRKVGIWFLSLPRMLVPVSMSFRINKVLGPEQFDIVVVPQMLNILISNIAPKHPRSSDDIEAELNEIISLEGPKAEGVHVDGMYRLVQHWRVSMSLSSVSATVSNGAYLDELDESQRVLCPRIKLLVQYRSAFHVRDGSVKNKPLIGHLPGFMPEAYKRITQLEACITLIGGREWMLSLMCSMLNIVDYHTIHLGRPTDRNVVDYSVRKTAYQICYKF